MHRYASASLNTLLDTGVDFAVGNLVLNAHGAGTWGMIFNMTAVAICAGFRMRSELAKPVLPIKAANQNQANEPNDDYSETESSPEPLKDGKAHQNQNILDSPGTAVSAAGFTQYAVFGLACYRALQGDAVALSEVMVPFSFATGNEAAAISFPSFSKPIQNLLKAPLMKEAPFATLPSSGDQNVSDKNVVQAVGAVAGKVMLTPQLYWASGLIMASGLHPLSTTLYFLGGTAAVVQTLNRPKPPESQAPVETEISAMPVESVQLKRPSSIHNIFNSEHMPTLLLASGCVAGSYENLTSLLESPQKTAVIIASGIYGLAYASYCVTKQYGGIVEATRVLKTQLKASLATLVS